MLEEKTINWLRLTLIPAIGPVRARKLLERFIQPDKILLASQKEIAAVLGNSLAEAINQQRKRIDIDKQLRLIEEYQVKIITQDNPIYPENLKNIFDPPLVLFLRGELLPCDDFSIAIVGTRMASIYGINMARKISTQLGQLGFTIIKREGEGFWDELPGWSMESPDQFTEFPQVCIPHSCGIEATTKLENAADFLEGGYPVTDVV